MFPRISAALQVAAGRWRWRNARTLADLADLRAVQLARQLNRRLDYSPTHVSMYATLVALGRAGVVVVDARPGTSTDDGPGLEPMETRACVTGFADTATKDWLDNLLYYAGKAPGTTKYELTHVFELYGPGSLEYDQSGGDDSYRNRGRAWVERIDGKPTARIGGQMDAGQVYRTFPTRRSVQRELREAWQITICAPTWGDSRMFVDLLQLLNNSDRPADSITT